MTSNYTVDGSETLRSPPFGMVLKPVVSTGISTTFTSTGAFPPDFWLPSTMYDTSTPQLTLTRSGYFHPTGESLHKDVWENCLPNKPNHMTPYDRRWIKRTGKRGEKLLPAETRVALH